MKRLLLLLVTSLLLSPAPAKETSDIKQLREYFKKVPGGPYIYQQSPRTGLDVGTIYTVVGGEYLYYSRPEDCFTKEFLAKAHDPADKVIARNFSVNGKFDWQIGLGVANAGPITEDVKAEFQHNHVSTLTLSVGPLTRSLITEKDLNEAIRNQVDLDCRTVLTSSKPERWIVMETLSADEFSLEFQDTNGKKVGVSAKILKVLFPSFSASKEQTIKVSTKFSGTKYIVATKEIRLKSTKFGAGDLEFEEVDPDDYYNIVDRSHKRGAVRSPGF